MDISTSQKMTLGYAALDGAGGVMGFVKGGSKISLVAGSLSASALYYVYTELPEGPTFASSVGLGVSATLVGAMSRRYQKTGKVFPAGVVALLSLGMSGAFIHGIFCSQS